MKSSNAHRACFSGDMTLFENTLQLDPLSFVKKDEHRVTPFYYACQNGHTRIVHKLLSINKNFVSQTIGRCPCGGSGCDDLDDCMDKLSNFMEIPNVSEPPMFPSLDPNEMMFSLNILPSDPRRKVKASMAKSSENGLPVLNLDADVYYRMLRENLIRIPVL